MLKTHRYKQLFVYHHLLFRLTYWSVLFVNFQCFFGFMITLVFFSKSLFLFKLRYYRRKGIYIAKSPKHTVPQCLASQIQSNSPLAFVFCPTHFSQVGQRKVGLVHQINPSHHFCSYHGYATGVESAFCVFQLRKDLKCGHQKISELYLDYITTMPLTF